LIKEVKNIKNIIFPKVSNRLSKILVLVDGSESSMNALELAVDLAATYGSKICIINIVPTYHLYSWLMAPGDAFCHESLFIQTDVLKEMEEEARSILISTLTLVQSVGIESYAIMGKGHPASEIVRIANQENVDLIVIGNTKSNIFTRLILGNVIHSIIRKAPCPILIVKRDKTHEDNK